jgi:acyl carrier protein
MTMEDVYSRLTTIFHDVFDDDAIVVTPDLTADDVPEWDSLSHIRLMLAVQKAFNIKMSAGQIASLKTVGDLANLVKAKTNA